MKKFWNFIILAIFGGVLGLQEFYLGRIVAGILAVLFWWSGIPALVGYIEAFVWLVRGEDEFNTKYGAIPQKSADTADERQLLND